MAQDTLLSFDTSIDPPGIEIIDRVEQLRYRLNTGEPVSPTPVPKEGFTFPVGRSFRIRTAELILPSDVTVVVRDGEGTMVEEIEPFETTSFPAGEYILDFSTQVKTYVEVEGPLEVTADVFQIRFDFDGPVDVDVGVRSRHNRPAATVTTTTDPMDVMKAIDTFRSGLKSTTPERSFPTLRGHPPRVELGSELAIPASLEYPETGIVIEVPPTFDAIYPVAPLAYYLGAELAPGPTPRLISDEGFEYCFPAQDGYEQAIERTLKQVFLLDCVTRTEGLYPLDLWERSELDRYLDLDWAELYAASPAERIESYLSVSYRVIESFVPEWRLTAHVEPNSDTVETLPFVVDDLAVVQTVDGVSSATADSRVTPVAGGDGFTRSTSQASPRHRSTADRESTDSFVQPEATDSLEQAWIGDDIPIGASKPTMEAFENRLNRSVTAGDIEITIVLNDSRMDEERTLVSEAYGDRDDLPFDVSVCTNLTVEQLRDRLEENRDFMHYIGHIDQEGFECTDGKLDAGTLDRTGIDAFLLNACRSYDQGLRLIEAGAIGGIVTLSEIISDHAVHVGELIARLLNAGFPLRAALSVAREESVLGGQYIVVGDGGMTLTQSQSRTPNLPEITPKRDGFAVDIQTFVTDSAGLGTIYTPYIGDNDDYYLTSGYLPTFQVSADELSNFLSLEDVPVRLGKGELTWSSSASLEEHF